ncbi:FTR1 family iron permease [Rhodomicrobium sp.]|uniref:FTR1 family iron permease n=1 Tax=Rhodomicrobium sp. TaxID=2720632 RepID=UPI0039E6EC6D
MHVLFGAALAEQGPNYRDLVGRIDAALTQAKQDYRGGRIDAAKDNVQRSYFEIFENLEGPIRVNISAKRSYQLEAEFGAIRKLMTTGASAEEIDARIDKHIAALDEIVPLLEKGHRIVAQKSDAELAAAQSAYAPAAEPVSAPAAQARAIEPYWQAAVARINADLLAAADALNAGDKVKAKAFAQKAHFEGYKNSLLETAIRRHVSQKQDVAFNAELSRIAALTNEENASSKVRASARALNDEMTPLLPGLPLVGNAKSEAVEAPAVNWQGVAQKIRADLASALALAASGQGTKAIGQIQDIYFDSFEGSGMEARVGARSADAKTGIEARFSKLMALIRDGAPAASVQAEADALNADIAKAADTLSDAASGSWLTLFSYSLLIILREGFEAMLIVSAILAYLVKTGNGDKQRVIVNSVGVALLASVATAILLKLVFRSGAASQEVLEGATMLLAAVVLFFTSNWLLAKAEADKWNAFIKDKLKGAVSGGSLAALWFVSFLAVYREGAETVLFYQALVLDADSSGMGAILAGFLAGCAGLAILFFVMRYGTLKLPLGLFFKATGALLYLMAFVFVGKGIMELVEGKIFTPTLIPGAPEFTPLGIYPYWETVIPQALLVLAAILSLVVIARKQAPGAIQASTPR